MEVFRYQDRLISVDVVSDVNEEGMVVECWDTTAAVGQGLLFRLIERCDEVYLAPEMTEIPVGLLRRVLESAGLGSRPADTS